MTENNANMRNIVKKVESCAMACLASQPSKDDACERHLMRTLVQIADMTKGYLGLVEVEAYDIEWDTDGKKVNLPDSHRMFVQSDEIENLADKLSDSFGWCVKDFSWRML